MQRYANIIVDISIDKLDKTFQYLIPERLADSVKPGVKVNIPFGPRRITGYVIEVTDKVEYDPSKLKEIISLVEGAVSIESFLISLAYWMSRYYGSTINQALKTVLPVKYEKKQIEKKSVKLLLDEEPAKELLETYKSKHYKAKVRLLEALVREKILDQSIITGKLQVATSVIKTFEKDGIVSVEKTSEYRNPVSHLKKKEYNIVLNDMQQAAVDTVMKDRAEGNFLTYLLKGVTGSGKTEVYMELISKVIEEGKQAIVLIPEIALTYQTVMRFNNRFGDRVSILNSKMTPAERYDQYLRAKNGDIDIMIGPRSALFSPFTNLGLIIIDEEHENTYKSETVPKYHARETASYIASMKKASLVLGSATPSMESYYRAKSGIYKLIRLDKRVSDRPLPECEVVDLRDEMRSGNRSIISRRLRELMEDRLEKKQQIMLFLNRRGVSGLVSCRSCGYVVKCPHCDVSLSAHNNGKMVCHYCGYETAEVHACPSCGSKYIGGFKAGTQKIEMMVQKEFPNARILRMDFDTTRAKDSYEKILQAFGNHEADILIGTQMIVKGHDFANVTLVGILASDMSLHVPDFHASERTFALLTQAAGRAGRGDEKGKVVIQSYDPKHYAITYAKEQDYEGFYEHELAYRQLMGYPPVANMLLLQCMSEDEEKLDKGLELIDGRVRDLIARLFKEKGYKILCLGPADASVRKINDVYRKAMYFKYDEYRILIYIKDYIENIIKNEAGLKDITIQFDFNPMSGF